jgi:membrane-bound lytic murein transglycosylase MltF
VRLRAQAQKQGLNPNKWFGNVELAAAKDMGRESVQYVSNIYKYYVAYKMAKDQRMIPPGSYRSGPRTPAASS